MIADMLLLQMVSLWERRISKGALSDLKEGDILILGRGDEGKYFVKKKD
jgi:hypothetical protein